MKETTQLVQMVDILPPYIPPSHFSITVIVIAVFIVVLLAYLYYKNPHFLLARQVRLKQISPRKAAHLLAQSKKLNAQQQAILKQLRFARTEPNKGQILSLINMKTHDKI